MILSLDIFALKGYIAVVRYRNLNYQNILEYKRILRIVRTSTRDQEYEFILYLASILAREFKVIMEVIGSNNKT